MDTMIRKPAAPTPKRSRHHRPVSAGPTPDIIVYNYRIAGVTYECAQDVTTLAEYVHGIRTDLPIQVRYAPHNPANSIIVAESWSGLRLNSSTPYQSESARRDALAGECSYVCAADLPYLFRNLLDGPVPPSQLKQSVDGWSIEAVAEQLRRIAADDRIGLDVGGDYSFCRDDRSVPNLHCPASGWRHGRSIHRCR